VPKVWAAIDLIIKISSHHLFIFKYKTYLNKQEQNLHFSLAAIQTTMNYRFGAPVTIHDCIVITVFCLFLSLGSFCLFVYSVYAND